MIRLCEKTRSADGRWLGSLHDELCAALAPVFAQARSRLAAFAYIGALLAAGGDRRSCSSWPSRPGTPRPADAGAAGRARLGLAGGAEGAAAVHLAHLADPAAVLVLDETAELKHGRMTVGVARQHAGITGQIENCQTVVFAAYVTARAHALSDFRLYLPRAWCGDRERRVRAHVPGDVQVATKTEQGTEMIAGAVAAGAPFGWVAGDEVYRRSSKLCAACEKHGKGYVLAVPVNFTVTLPSRRRVTAASLARMVPAAAGRRARAGQAARATATTNGLGGNRLAAALAAAPAQPVRPGRPGDVLLPRTRGPPGIAAVLISIAGRRWPAEECHQQAKARPASISTRFGCGTPSTATPSCPCAPSRSWASPPPGRCR
jgi:hypothetical protein